MVRDPFAMLKSEYKLLFIGGSSRRNLFKQKPELTTVILIEKIGSNLVATKKSWFATCLRGLNLNKSCYLLGVRPQKLVQTETRTKKVISVEKIGSNLIATKKSWIATSLRGSILKISTNNSWTVLNFTRTMFSSIKTMKNACFHN